MTNTIVFRIIPRPYKFAIHFYFTLFHWLFYIDSDHHVSPNIADGNSLTPLHHAARRGHMRCVYLLVEFKADMNALTSCGWSPLFYAAQESHSDVAMYLLDIGAKHQLCICGATIVRKPGISERNNSYYENDWRHKPLLCAVKKMM
eukprot:GHVR01078457.1.p1 GENE.GHVR01078457.1~~GHVR01078457.1.p1  ORF type:complete len:146 (-),score=5.30 GHVR01078457.1:181-618(-)